MAGLKDLKEVRGLLAKDLAVLASREGLDLVPGDDPMLLAYLLDPSNTTPEGVARRYGGEWTEDAAHRALLSERLHRNLLKRLEGEEKLLWLYHEVEKPLSRVLAHMEATGVRLDVAYLQALSLELAEEIRRLEEEVFRLAGHPFNLNSRDQLERVLFDELRLPALGKTQKTGKRSTSAAVLEALREAHPIVEKILQHRELTKLKNTYVDPLPSLVHPRTGRLHTRFNQTATATGRLSSSDPNLQNIPVRTPLGQRIRRAFVAEAGWALVALDYSQIELRVLAHLSGDENLIRVFQEGKDIHTQTASWMFGVPPEAVDPLMRRAAKTVNFGVLYGMSAHRLSQELAIPYEEAVAFAKSRSTFGEPLAKKQLVQAKLAEMLAWHTEGLLLAWRLARLKDEGKLTPAQVSLAKRQNVWKALQAARMARDILGGSGITLEYHAIRHMLNLETVYTYEGTHDVHTLVLGREITGLNAF